MFGFHRRSQKLSSFTGALAKPRKCRLRCQQLQFSLQVAAAEAIQHYAAGHASASLTEAATWEMLVATATMSIPIL